MYQQTGPPQNVYQQTGHPINVYQPGPSMYQAPQFDMAGVLSNIFFQGGRGRGNPFSNKNLRSTMWSMMQQGFLPQNGHQQAGHPQNVYQQPVHPQNVYQQTGHPQNVYQQTGQPQGPQQPRPGQN